MLDTTWWLLTRHADEEETEQITDWLTEPMVSTEDENTVRIGA